MIISLGQRTLYFRPSRNCEHNRNVWLASSGTVIAGWHRVRLVNAQRRPGLLDGVEAADFRRDFAGIGRERVAGDGAPGASMNTKNLGVLLQEAWIGHKYNNLLEHKTPTNRY